MSNAEKVQCAATPRPPANESRGGGPDADQEVRRRKAHGGGPVRDGRPPGEDPQRRVGRPFRLGEDNPGRGSARGHRDHHPSRNRRGGIDGQRFRPGRGRPATVRRPGGLPTPPRRHRREPPGHPGLPGLHRRAAGRAAGGRCRAVRGVRGGRHRPDHLDPVGGVRRARHAAGGRHDAAGHPTGLLRRLGRGLPARVRRGRRPGRAAALPARRRTSPRRPRRLWWAC